MLIKTNQSTSTFEWNAAAMNRATMHAINWGWCRLDIQLRFNDDGIEIKRDSENWNGGWAKGGGRDFQFRLSTTKRVRNDRRWLALTFHFILCSRKLTNMYTSTIRAEWNWLKSLAFSEFLGCCFPRLSMTLGREMIEKSKVMLRVESIEFDWIFVQFPLSLSRLN